MQQLFNKVRFWLSGSRIGVEQNGDEHAAQHSDVLLADAMIWTFIVLIALVIATTVFVTFGNLPQMTALLLGLLAVGVGQAILLPPMLASMGALLIIVAWVLLRLVTGIWIEAERAQNIVELGLLTITLLSALRIHILWTKQAQELASLRSLRDVLVADEGGSGLLPREVAELRLQEELGRAKLFRRPLGLLLIEIAAHQDQQIEPADLEEVDRAITRQLSSASLLHDIPFRLAADSVGLIMPERNWEQLYIDADKIIEAINGAALVDELGGTRSVLRYAGIQYGLGTYQGEPGEEQEVNLLRAARDSLSISRDTAVLGSAHVSAFALSAAPIMSDGPAMPDGEE